jgi:hypothetical protein
MVNPLTSATQRGDQTPQNRSCIQLWNPDSFLVVQVIRQEFHPFPEEVNGRRSLHGITHLFSAGSIQDRLQRFEPHLRPCTSRQQVYAHMRLDGVGNVGGSSEFNIGKCSIIHRSVSEAIPSTSATFRSAELNYSPHDINQHDRDPHDPQAEDKDMNDRLCAHAFQMRTARPFQIRAPLDSIGKP